MAEKAVIEAGIRMKVVMVDDCAYVGYELRKGLIGRGYDVEHFLFGKSRLPKIATLKMALKLRRTKCSLIHAHYCRSAAYAAYFSSKPYIVHCHGSDIRGGIGWLKKRSLAKAKKMLVSTPDLLEILPNATWLPNPVDTDRFKPLKRHDGNRVLYFPHWYENLTRELKDICSELNYDLTISDAYFVPYEKMHLFLNDFDIFVDRFSIKSYSKTALEAMSCGLAVVGHAHDLGKTLTELSNSHERKRLVTLQSENVLSQHEVKAVINMLVRIYQEISEV